MIEGYLLEREGLDMVFVLVDGAIGPTPLDQQMLDWLRENEVPHTVVATKMDKVKSAKRKTRKRELAEGCMLEIGDIVWVSSAKGGQHRPAPRPGDRPPVLTARRRASTAFVAGWADCGARPVIGRVIDHFDAAWNELSAEGSGFAMTEIEVRGMPIRVFNSAPPTMRSLWELAQLHGDKTYIVFEDERYTYAEIDAQVRSLAALPPRRARRRPRRPGRDRDAQLPRVGRVVLGDRRRSARPSSG